MDLTRYKRGIKEIKEYAAKNNLSEEEVERVFEECFHLLEIETSTKLTLIFKILKCIFTIILLFVSSLFILYNHPATHNIFLRNLQDFIYPGLKIFRKLAVPIVTVYPSLTEWYDEWCLLENPYFHVNEMDCWPCSNVNSVQDLTGYNITPVFNIGIPFIRQESIKKIDFNNIYNIYIKYKDIFDRDAGNIFSNKVQYFISDIMERRLDIKPSIYANTHIKWRINRMEPGRKLRKLFSKPIGTPDWWSPSIEKFLLIDEPKSEKYLLPNPECANVIIQCTNGERLLQLKPSPECMQNCKTLTVLLTTGQTIWYNWWYWRPISYPSDNSTSISIMYLSSYC